MTCFDNSDDQCFVFNAVDDAVVTRSNAVFVFSAFEFFAS